MLSGRTPEQKRDLVAFVTRAVVDALDVKENVVTVKLIEHEKSESS
jgi:phenylpyruvate tautomerase PptA (4-oxalocrotonate tautomerase family)